MGKLKKKIFWVMFAILTIFLVSVLCIFNFQDYNHEKVEIENKLSRMENDRQAPGIPVFMDAVVYTVKYNTSNKVTEVINHTNNNVSNEKIIQIAENILENENTKQGKKIGNLYLDQYSYAFQGPNTLTCDLTDSNTKLNGQSTTYKNIFLYQSMSGDASNGTATFTAKNSNITTNNGDTFYITNTTATINLENNTIINNDSTGNFLRAQKDSWGKSGSNGGNVTLKMTNQKAEGNIEIDSISTLDMEMAEGSYYEGTINGANESKSITLKLDSTSKIKLTGNSYVTSLEDEDSTYSNIDFNGYTLYVNGVAIN